PTGGPCGCPAGTRWWRCGPGPSTSAARWPWPTCATPAPQSAAAAGFSLRHPAISPCRWLLDLDADPVATGALLSADPLLAPLVAKAPGRRVPRTVDAAEFALRAVIGQQVSTAAARTHAGRLATAYGEPVADPAGGPTPLFPSPAVLARALPA